MTQQEAFDYFKSSDEEEIEEIYEEKLFEYKKFFLSKVPVDKLFRGRISQLVQLQAAYTAAMASDEKKIAFTLSEFSLLPEQYNLLSVFFSAYQKVKNELKQKISRSSQANELIVLAEALVSLEKEYAKAWYSEIVTDESVIVSKEPDPMYLLESIRRFEESGGKTIDDLKKSGAEAPGLLFNEMKRLSLLYKKF